MGLVGGVRLQIPVSQQQQQQLQQAWGGLVTTGGGGGALRAPGSLGSGPRPTGPPATLLPIGSRAVTMAALNFRPPMTATTAVSRPMMTDGGRVTLVQATGGPNKGGNSGGLVSPALALKTMVPSSNSGGGGGGGLGGMQQAGAGPPPSPLLLPGGVGPPHLNKPPASSPHQQQATRTVVTSAASNKLVSPTTAAPAVSLTPATHIQVSSRVYATGFYMFF